MASTALSLLTARPAQVGWSFVFDKPASWHNRPPGYLELCRHEGLFSCQCTGKTYTMEGGPRESDDGKKLSAQAGVIPRSIKQIFDCIEESSIDSTVKVRCNHR